MYLMYLHFIFCFNFFHKSSGDVNVLHRSLHPSFCSQVTCSYGCYYRWNCLVNFFFFWFFNTGILKYVFHSLIISTLKCSEFFWIISIAFYRFFAIYMCKVTPPLPKIRGTWFLFQLIYLLLLLLFSCLNYSGLNFQYNMKYLQH